MTFKPPAMAVSTSPAHKAEHAAFTAARPLEPEKNLLAERFSVPKGRQTGGVHVEAGSTELKEVVDPSVREATLATGDGVRSNVLAGVEFTPIIARLAIVGADPRGGSGARSVGGVSGHLKSFVSSDKGKAMHRIHLFCLQ